MRLTFWSELLLRVRKSSRNETKSTQNTHVPVRLRCSWTNCAVRSDATELFCQVIELEWKSSFVMIFENFNWFWNSNKKKLFSFIQQQVSPKILLNVDYLNQSEDLFLSPKDFSVTGQEKNDLIHQKLVQKDWEKPKIIQV